MNTLERSVFRPMAVSATLAALALVSHAADAQNVLTIGSASLTIPQPGAAQYLAGFSDSASVTFNVDVSGSSARERITEVRILCSSVTSGKPCSDVQWRMTAPGSSGWSDLSGAFVFVDKRCVVPGSGGPPGGTHLCVDAPGSGEPYNGVIWLRMKLSWTADVPATYDAVVRITLGVYRQAP